MINLTVVYVATVIAIVLIIFRVCETIETISINKAVHKKGEEDDK